MLLIYTAANLMEAQLLVGLLARAGIAAEVMNRYAQGATGELPVDQARPQIWLERDSDKSRALEIVRDYEATPATSDWIYCRHCRERNPDNFELCWKCGEPLQG
ncbi:MAG TPA: DUF2007 domain-containing protein [Chromatiales bacterium]|nr:DUF2007 domain-containing protein [Chromatiales bacterium]